MDNCSNDLIGHGNLSALYPLGDIAGKFLGNIINR